MSNGFQRTLLCAQGGGLELLPDRAMEGKDFRARVYRKNEQTGESEFDQQAFDKIWPCAGAGDLLLRACTKSGPKKTPVVSI